MNDEQMEVVCRNIATPEGSYVAFGVRCGEWVFLRGWTSWATHGLVDKAEAWGPVPEHRVKAYLGWIEAAKQGRGRYSKTYRAALSWQIVSSEMAETVRLGKVYLQGQLEAQRHREQMGQNLRRAKELGFGVGYDELHPLDVVEYAGNGELFVVTTLERGRILGRPVDCPKAAEQLLGLPEHLRIWRSDLTLSEVQAWDTLQLLTTGTRVEVTRVTQTQAFGRTEGSIEQERPLGDLRKYRKV
jgi:hypothetical protein